MLRLWINKGNWGLLLAGLLGWLRQIRLRCRQDLRRGFLEAVEWALGCRHGVDYNISSKGGLR